MRVKLLVESIVLSNPLSHSNKAHREEAQDTEQELVYMSGFEKKYISKNSTTD